MDATTKNKIAEFICGDNKAKYPIYRSSTYLTRFFQDVGINVKHDGSSRNPWTYSVITNLDEIDLQKVILRLTSPKLYGGDREQIRIAFNTMNEILAVEGLKIYLNGIEPQLVKEKPNYDFSDKHKERKLVPLPPPDFDSLQLEYGISEILKQR